MIVRTAKQKQPKPVIKDRYMKLLATITTEIFF